MHTLRVLRIIYQVRRDCLKDLEFEFFEFVQIYSESFFFIEMNQKRNLDEIFLKQQKQDHLFINEYNSSFIDIFFAFFRIIL